MPRDADLTRPADPTSESIAVATPGERIPGIVIPKGTVIGRYLVGRPLGFGGMGVVYSAYDSELDRQVALKVLHQAVEGAEGHARLLREAQAMAKVSHPNVISIHDVGFHGDQLFLAMDMVKGGTLLDWVNEKDRPWQETARVLLDAGYGLAAAHEAGLVHRDFKPQNVLVRRDGQVFVTDFGLARMAAGRDGATSASLMRARREVERPSPLASDLTRAGVVMGTPQYLAPERLLGERVDARADQFSFCATLYWSIWRAYPFEPADIAWYAERLASRDDGATAPVRNDAPPALIREPPFQPRVPARLRRAILRGLSLEPEKRFPNMGALLAEISAALHPPMLQVAIGSAALAMVVVAAVSAWGFRDRTRPQLCSGGAAEIGAVWSDQTAAAVQAGFVAVAPDRGAELARPLVAALNGYAARWVQGYREACEATRLRGEQTEAILALRMQCLERKRKELAALVRLLERPDLALAERAVDASQGLSAVGQCGDAEALAQAQAELPEDPARRAQLQKVEEQLARAHALRIAGRYSDGLLEAEAAAGAAHELAFKPLEAQARLELGLLQDATADQQGAVGTFLEAMRLAEAGRDDVTKLRAYSRLALVLGYRQHQVELGVSVVRQAEATLERLGAERYPDLESDLATMLGLIELRAGDYQAALPAFQRSLASAERAAGAEMMKARALANIAATRGRLGDREEAVASGRLAIAAFERLRGPDHPILIEPLTNLAADLAELGRLEEALELANRAVALVESRLGQEHPSLADALDMRAGIYLQLNRPNNALADAQRALALHRKGAKQGPNPVEAYSLDPMGRAQLALGKTAEAVASLEKALALAPPDEGAMAEIRFGLARALGAARREPARAHELATRARATFARLKNERRLTQLDAWLALQGPRGAAARPRPK